MIRNLSNVIFDRRSGFNLLGGLRWWSQKVEIQLFQNVYMLPIKLKGIRYAATVLKNILPAAPFPDPGSGVNTSKCGHVEYQIKWYHICSNMVVNILPAYPTPRPQLWGEVSRLDWGHSPAHGKDFKGCPPGFNPRAPSF